MLDKRIISENIKKLRTASNLSQSGLAERLNISPQSVSKWECGISVPDIDNLCIMAKIFGVSVEYIVGAENKTNDVLIGIDCGGSKTEIVSFELSGKIIRRILKGAGNPNTIGLAESANVIREGISEALPHDGRLCGVFVGGAGFLTGDNGKKIKEILSSSFPGVKIKCHSDILNVIASCTDEEKCIAVICGTGSVVFAKEGTQLTKYGGWGPLLSNTGCGYDIGRDGIVHALLHHEGRGEETLITGYVRDNSGISFEKLIAEVHKRESSYIASFSSCVFRAYSEGDKVASDILEKNAQGLSEIINHVAEKYGIYDKVIISGGIVSNDDVFINIMKKYISKKITVIVPEKPQIYGACVLAANLLGADTDDMKKEFMNDYRRITEEK